MPVTIFFIVVSLAVVAVAAGVSAGRLNGGFELPTSPVPVTGLPEGRVPAEALADVRFAQALRGYRMDQVDVVLDQLQTALAERDAEIERLREELGPRRTTEPAADGAPASDAAPEAVPGPARGPEPEPEPKSEPEPAPEPVAVGAAEPAAPSGDDPAPGTA